MAKNKKSKSPLSKKKKKLSNFKRLSNKGKAKKRTTDHNKTADLDTSSKSLVNNCTIDLVVSDDEDEANVSNACEKSINTSEVIEINENSMTLDEVVVVCEGTHKSVNVEALESSNEDNETVDDIIIDREGTHGSEHSETSQSLNDDVIDITKDEDIQVVEKVNNDDIVVLHSNCKSTNQDDIEFIGEHPGKHKNLSHKWKEKNKLPDFISLNSNVNCYNSGKNHFNAPAYFNKIQVLGSAKKRKRGKNLNRKSNENNVNKRNNENKTKKKLSKKKELFLKQLEEEVPKTVIIPQTSKVPQQLSELGENVYSANPISIPTSGLRPIVIDGSNVAFQYANTKEFSCKGLEICIKYFKERGHKVTAFVPQFRLKNGKSDNPKLLEQLRDQGDVILTPSRMVDGVPIVSYDDRFIVQFAAAKGGIIVTRDNYNDLLGENPIWDETIKFRLLQFTWVDDFLMFPKDPLGIGGPSLSNFLKFS